MFIRFLRPGDHLKLNEGMNKPHKQKLLSFTVSAPHACLPCTVTMMMMTIKVCMEIGDGLPNAANAQWERPVAMKEVTSTCTHCYNFLHTVGISFVFIVMLCCCCDDVELSWIGLAWLGLRVGLVSVCLE